MDKKRETPPEGYQKILEENHRLIKDLENDEFREDSRESVKSVNENIKLSKDKTVENKNAFISQIKNGLGDEIKDNPRKIEYVHKEKEKESWVGRFKRGLKKIFNII